jgi:hypothetical protein
VERTPRNSQPEDQYFHEAASSLEPKNKPPFHDVTIMRPSPASHVRLLILLIGSVLTACHVDPESWLIQMPSGPAIQNTPSGLMEVTATRESPSGTNAGRQFAPSSWETNSR